LCRALVSAVLAIAPRCRRVARRARSGGGLHDDLALGAMIRSRIGTATAAHLTPTNKSWRVDETYIRVQGRWCYLYRAIDSTDATIDFLLSALREAAAAKRLFRQALNDSSHPQPRVINTDQARLCGAAIAAVKSAGTLHRRCRHRPVQYLNNILEPDHRAIKRRVKATQSFREFRSSRANDRRIRSHAHDPQWAGAVGQRQNVAGCPDAACRTDGPANFAPG
jgi:transposase-like protein